MSDDYYESKNEVENESTNTDLSKKIVCVQQLVHSLFRLLSSSERCYFQRKPPYGKSKIASLYFNKLPSNLFGNPLNNEFHLSTELWGINEKIRHCRASKLEL